MQYLHHRKTSTLLVFHNRNADTIFYASNHFKMNLFPFLLKKSMFNKLLKMHLRNIETTFAWDKTLF